MLKAGQAATRVVRACVKDAKAAALASEAKSYYTVIKYETKDGQAKELSREPTTMAKVSLIRSPKWA